MSQQHNGTSAVDEVLAFFSEWGPTIKDMRDSMERRFTPETVWENVGASKTVGSEQALAFTDAFNAQMSVARAEVIVHHIAAAGNAVLTERTDLFYNEIGRATCRERVCQYV